ncbi:NAD(P)-binding protein [Lophiostoma macrostomum CBS 122681]|uniref:NAD(P)-binding protein n=1 Tax=Lophiostoma macrostomum CBS 122681 TaxID=1314788 RepID=A0A6A6TQR0_9PLEO|nr:NAD(P)-binding protein [Lophiostoma macrostomum CBS 122681]
MSTPISNIALIGASGMLGPSILAALRAHPTFTPFVLNRHSSKSIYPKTRVITIPDDLNIPELTTLLKEAEIDALVIAIAGSHVEPQKKLIEAAFNAGVKRVIPAEFGSCDSADERTNQILPLMEGKKRVRDILIDVSKRGCEGEGVEELTWTSLVPGHFFDAGLGYGLLKFDVRKRKAYLIDGGDVKFSASNLGFIADAVVRILERYEETANRMLYVHSHYVTQKEVLASLEKATGDKFEVSEESSEEVIRKARPKLLEGDHDAMEETVAVHGLVASDWSQNKGFANELLGLKEEDLDEVVKRVVGELK